MKKLSLICVVLLLSACGGGSSIDFGEGGSTPPPPAPAPAPTVDAFYARLIGIVGNFAEDTEPGDISAIVATEPEDSEPPVL